LNTGFIITDAGLAAATVADPSGPYVHITSFKVGSAYNYTPTRSQTALSGTVLYTGTVSSYAIVGPDLLSITLLMDSDVGSFQFGEVGIFLGDGTLFATCAFDHLQDKIRAVGVTAGNIWRIKSLLKLAQAPAIVQIDLVIAQSILEVATWPLLEIPVDQLNDANIAIVHHNNQYNEPVLVIRDTDTEWGLIGYSRMLNVLTTDIGASVTTTTFTHPFIARLNLEVPSDSSRYLVKFPDGQIRAIIDKPTVDSIEWYPATPLPAGQITLWRTNGDCCEVYWADTVEYNALAADFNPYWTTPTGTYSASNKGMNQVAVPTLSRRTVTADWQLLLAAMIKVSNILGISAAPITGFDDFVFDPYNASFAGLQTIRARWDATVAQIALMEANRNNYDAAYQTLTAYTVQTHTSYWTGLKTFTFTFDYTSTNIRQGHLNSGHQLVLVPTVDSPTVTSWTTLQTIFATNGGFTLRGDTVVADAFWNPTAIGLQEFTGTFQTLASATSGVWTFLLKGRNVGNTIEIAFEITNSLGVYSYPSTTGTINFAASSRKATALNNPVLANPALTYSSV
jgi:Phage tail-collar fibre protein